MTKYVCVKTAPQELEKTESIVVMPDFVQDVLDCKQRMPNSGLLSPVYARALIDFIGHRYDEMFPGAGKFVAQEINGVPFANENDVALAIKNLFRKYYPQIFDKHIEYQVKNLPHGTKLVYFVGDHLDASTFNKFGIDRIDIKDVDFYMSRKDKKPNKGSFKKSEEV
jgi:hypothetical protein